VETLEQLETLKAMGCDSLQGYYFSKPVPPADIPGLLDRIWEMGGPATKQRGAEVSIASD